MKNRKIIAVVGILLILGVLVGYKIIRTSRQQDIETNKSQEEAKVHYHAGFVVFDNGKKVDFSDLKYMLIKPCALDGKEEEDDSPEHIQLEKAHLHDNIGDVVHVEGGNAKWSDLFSNIKYPIDYSKTTVYKNGQKIENIKDSGIGENESVVIFLGKVDETLLNQAVTSDHIKEVADKSETCGN